MFWICRYDRTDGFLFGYVLSYLPFTGCLNKIICVDEKPDVAYSDIGGMDIQKQEVKEAVELPLTHFELYKQVQLV